MMLRPRWIGALVFALLLAGGFAWLGQWQLERAVEAGTVVDIPSETVLPLAKVAQPNGPIRDTATGQLVTLTGSFVPGDYQLLQGRLNHGSAGWWVVGHVTVSGTDGDAHPVALAVARGWAPDEKTAKAAVARLADLPERQEEIVGRLLPTEAPEVPTDKKHPTVMSTMAVAALYNLWTGVDGMDVYSAYVVEKAPPAGLTKIDSPPPIQERTLNWLNIFYAAEWIIFAGFAVFFWYRLVKDAKEKEDELRELAAGTAAPLGKVE